MHRQHADRRLHVCRLGTDQLLTITAFICPLRWARPLRRTVPKPSQGPPLRGALTGEVNLSVPAAQAGMHDDACVIHAEQMVAAA